MGGPRPLARIRPADPVDRLLPNKVQRSLSLEISGSAKRDNQEPGCAAWTRESITSRPSRTRKSRREPGSNDIVMSAAWEVPTSLITTAGSSLTGNESCGSLDHAWRRTRTSAAAPAARRIRSLARDVIGIQKPEGVHGGRHVLAVRACLTDPRFGARGVGRAGTHSRGARRWPSVRPGRVSQAEPQARLGIESQRMAEQSKQPRAPAARGSEDPYEAGLERVRRRSSVRTRSSSRIPSRTPRPAQPVRVVVERVPVL